MNQKISELLDQSVVTVNNPEFTKEPVPLQENSTRTNFAERFQKIIDKYDSCGTSNKDYYSQLINFAENLKAEVERHIKEGLNWVA
jgi:hypothetical protein